jgi:SAM-dependent methyltransferase
LDPFSAYGRVAELLHDRSVVAGRYSFQRVEEESAREDVRNKLELSGDDRLLEIGCGSGNLLLPLAASVSAAVGVDHPSCLRVIQRAGVPANVELVAGRWPGVAVAGHFSKVLAYSVMHYLDGQDAAFAFIDACLEVMRPGSRLLLGDIPNSDAARRFKATDFGASFAEAWSERTRNESSDEDRERDVLLSSAKLPPYLGDDFVLAVLARYRGQGYEAYVLPQPIGLPFCYTREDILIAARE